MSGARVRLPLAEATRLFREARERRRSLEEGAGSTCYRLFHGDADGLDGVTVDWFDGVAVLSLYLELPELEERALVEAVAQAFSPVSIYLKRRPKEARVVANTRKALLAPEVPVFGEPVEERVVLENGLRFLIRPGQGLSVGLYLDMRETRAWVKERARGQSVLNLFSYTCGFGLAALAGGAERAVNIDLSRRVLDWGEENLRLNGFEPLREDFLSGDVFEWLARLSRRDQRFSMAILDPPGFATAGKRRFSAATQYAQLVEAVLPVLRPGGTLIACCNVAQLASRRFEAQVEQGLEGAGRSGHLRAALGASPVDFPVRGRGEGALKVRIYAVG